MNETFTLSSKTYLNLSEFQKHLFGTFHNLCVHFGRLELLYPYILLINILHRELWVLEIGIQTIGEFN